MRRRSSIFALSPFHLRAWPSQLRTFAHFQLHTFELSTLASSPYRRMCEGTNSPNGTQQWNTLELHVYTSLIVVFRLDRSHIRTFDYKRRYEKEPNTKFESQHLHIRECRRRVFFCLHMKEVPRYTCSEMYQSRNTFGSGLCPLFDWLVIVRGNRISLLWLLLKTKVAYNFGWFDTMDYFPLAYYILRR